MSVPFTLPKQYVPDHDGSPLLGAKLYFYIIGTSTPKDTFTDSSLADPHPNPVTADSFGLFPQIWLDTSGVDYRVTVTDQFESAEYTIDGLLSQASPLDLLNDIKTVDGAGSGLDADTLDGLDSAAFAQLAAAQTISGIWNYTEQPYLFGLKMGFRNIPVREFTALHELQLQDDGYTVSSTTGGLRIPVVSQGAFNIGAFVQGHTTCFYNDSAANQTIIAETPATTTLRLAGTTTTGTRTVAARGLAVCYQIKLNEWLIYGVGVS